VNLIAHTLFCQRKAASDSVPKHRGKTDRLRTGGSQEGQRHTPDDQHNHKYACRTRPRLPASRRDIALEGRLVGQRCHGGLVGHPFGG
jgi:hypothetical protein